MSALYCWYRHIKSISVLYSAAKKLGIDNGCRDNVPEEMVDQAILKEVKSVKEQIETCPAERTEREYVFDVGISFLVNKRMYRKIPQGFICLRFGSKILNGGFC